MQVVLETSAGDITLELDSEAAPITVGNFVQYARDGHNAGTIFDESAYTLFGGFYPRCVIFLSMHGTVDKVSG